MAETYHIDTNNPVLVTGASGYVAGWLIKRLLEAGATVHGTVRDASNEAKTAAVRALAENVLGKLVLFSADLEKEGSFDAAMAGCQTVFHAASPFTLETNVDPEKTFVAPARNGTRNVLDTVNRTETVKRVVVTSSCAAIYGDASDYKATPEGKFTEAVWNTTSSLTNNPYSYSKTVAEKLAWEMAEKQDRWRLTTVNPSLVMGPSVSGSTNSGSFDVLRMLGGGDMRTGAPRLAFAMVDVRDVVEIHLRAAFMESAKGRHIASGYNSDMVEMGQILAEEFAGYPLPKRALPKWLVWLVGPMQGIPRSFVSNNVNVPMKIDNAKSISDLGMKYRPMKESLVEMFQQAVDTGFFKK